MQFKHLGPAAMCALVLSLPVLAHHSHGNYQMTEYTLLNGRVTEIHWINPHVGSTLKSSTTTAGHSVGSRRSECHPAQEDRLDGRQRQSGRPYRRAVPSAQGRLQWLSSGVCDTEGGVEKMFD